MKYFLTQRDVLSTMITGQQTNRVKEEVEVVDFIDKATMTFLEILMVLKAFSVVTVGGLSLITLTVGESTIGKVMKMK